ncbi:MULTISPECIES: hypothetical protein [unclassified Nocardioides]|uniref:hypothetical protein n=1 Tax=unclassified Nocardioides TaxID=2615069 RepID=UPI00070122E6|nr:MULTISPECIES: hypothetical protein [unclassified Nocardioides]KQY57222.1 hypothetical protein ASD30_13345 [Nocardioides sp. Root140]KQZ68737.1 hypothetical protein ASD66_15800 [Nocardioides sp. Root151]KRF11866.1 hypothetical protein ASH02_18020 [Nocardioides sp. Soil796]
MTPVLISALVAAGFVSLSLWGLRNVEELVPERPSMARRDKELRSLKRGARSCFLIGLLFATWAVVLAVNLVLDSR